MWGSMAGWGLRKEREVESELGMSVVGMERKGRMWARGIDGPWHLIEL